MKDRLRFQRRAVDANGVRAGSWTDEATLWAALTWLRGSEAVMEARLQGRQPVVIEIHESSLARQMDNSWRAVGAGGEVFDFKSAAPSRTSGRWEILAEVKVGARG